MFPRPPTEDGTETAFGDVIFSFQVSPSDARCVISANGADFVLSEAATSSDVITAPFEFFVAHVVKSCTEKKMINTHASGRVTSMQDLKTIGDMTEGKYPSETMRSHLSFVQFKPSIPGFIFTTDPQPTIIGLFDLGPKTACPVVGLSSWHG